MKKFAVFLTKEEIRKIINWLYVPDDTLSPCEERNEERDKFVKFFKTYLKD